MAQKIIRNEELSLACTEYARVYKELQQAELKLKEMGGLIQESLKQIFQADLAKGEAITTYKIPVINKATAEETGDFVQFQIKTGAAAIDSETYEAMVEFLDEDAPAIVSKDKAINEITDGSELLKSLAELPLPISTSAKGDIVVKLDGVRLDQLNGITVCEVTRVESGLLDKVATKLEAKPDKASLVQMLVDRCGSTTLVAASSTAKAKGKKGS